MELVGDPNIMQINAELLIRISPQEAETLLEEISGTSMHQDGQLHRLCHLLADALGMEESTMELPAIAAPDRSAS